MRTTLIVLAGAFALAGCSQEAAEPAPAEPAAEPVAAAPAAAGPVAERDAAWTLQAGRRAFTHRRAVVAATVADAVAAGRSGLLHATTGWGVWLWLGPLVILGIVPLIDWTSGLDPSNPPDDVIKALKVCVEIENFFVKYGRHTSDEVFNGVDGGI